MIIFSEFFFLSCSGHSFNFSGPLWTLSHCRSITPPFVIHAFKFHAQSYAVLVQWYACSLRASPSLHSFLTILSLKLFDCNAQKLGNGQVSGILLYISYLPVSSGLVPSASSFVISYCVLWWQGPWSQDCTAAFWVVTEAINMIIVLTK